MSLSFVYFDIVVVTCNYVSKVPSFIRIRFESGVWASFLVRSSCDSIFESFLGEDFRLSRAIFPFVALHEYCLKIPSFYSNKKRKNRLESEPEQEPRVRQKPKRFRI